MKIYKQYIRNKDNTPHGVAVLVKTDNYDHLGYSLVNPKADRFEKKRGTDIAMARAFCGRDVCPKVESRKKLIQKYWFDLIVRAHHSDES